MAVNYSGPLWHILIDGIDSIKRDIGFYTYTTGLKGWGWWGVRGWAWVSHLRSLPRPKHKSYGPTDQPKMEAPNSPSYRLHFMCISMLSNTVMYWWDGRKRKETKEIKAWRKRPWASTMQSMHDQEESPGLTTCKDCQGHKPTLQRSPQ